MIFFFTLCFFWVKKKKIAQFRNPIRKKTNCTKKVKNIQKQIKQQTTNKQTKKANGLKHLGVTKGDRIGILLPQALETGVSHVATYKSGCIRFVCV